MKPRTNYHKPVLLAFAGVAAVMGLGWAIGPEGRAEYARLTAPPRGPELPPSEFRTVMSMTTHSEFHHEISDADWTRLKAIYARNHHDPICFGPLLKIRKSFGHRDEAIAMLEGYLGEGHKDGNLVATIALRSLDAPNWRAHADALRASNDADARNLARRAFGIERGG